MDFEELFEGFEKKKFHNHNHEYSNYHNNNFSHKSSFNSSSGYMPSVNIGVFKKFLFPAVFILGIFLILIVTGGIFIGSFLFKGAVGIASQAQKTVQQQAKNLIPSGIQDKQQQISDIYNEAKNVTSPSTN